MAKLSNDELQQIIEVGLPGHRIVTGAEEDHDLAVDSSTESAPSVEADTPEIESLRRKYLRGRYLTGAASDSIDAWGSNDNPRGDNDDVEIVLVESKNSSDPLDRRSQVKAVLVDTRERKIIGAQG